MSTTVPIRIKQKHDIAANWSSNNPILLDGELGFVTDAEYTGQYKIGNGTSNWNDLPYAFQEIDENFAKKLGEIVLVVGDVTLTESNSSNKVLLVSNTANIIVPNIIDGFNVVIKNISDKQVTIVPLSTTIDGLSDSFRLRKYEFVRLIQYSNNYYIVESNILDGIKVGDYTIETVGSLLSNDKLG